MPHTHLRQLDVLCHLKENKLIVLITSTVSYCTIRRCAGGWAVRQGGRARVPVGGPQGQTGGRVGSRPGGIAVAQRAGLPRGSQSRKCFGPKLSVSRSTVKCMFDSNIHMLELLVCAWLDHNKTCVHVYFDF